MPRFHHSAYHPSHYHTTSSSNSSNAFLQVENRNEIIADFYTAYDTVGLSTELLSHDTLLLADCLLCLKAIEDNKDELVSLQSKNRKTVDLNGAKDFIQTQIPNLYRIGNSLLTSTETNERLSGECLKNIAIHLGYNPTSNAVTTNTSTTSPANNISPNATKRTNNLDCIMYRAKNGEIGLKFIDPDARNAFLKVLTENGFNNDNVVPKTYRIGLQYVHNQEGKNPVTYSSSPNTLYFMTYKAAQGELGVNLGSENNRSALLKSLGYSPRLLNSQNNIQQINSFTGDPLFKCYGGNQNTTIYFENNVFTNDNHVQFKGKMAASSRKIDPTAKQLLDELRNARDNQMRAFLGTLIIDPDLKNLPDLFEQDLLINDGIVKDIMEKAKIISNAINNNEFAKPELDQAIAYIQNNINKIPLTAYKSITGRRPKNRQQLAIEQWKANVSLYKVPGPPPPQVVNQSDVTSSSNIPKQEPPNLYHGGR